MRIISGYLKGRKIIQPKNKLTRPLKDLTKESIFNILQHSNLINFSIKKSQVLDLFSGVGSFGLECISRGAKNIFFIENSKDALNILEKNILNLNCQEKSYVIKKNAFEIKNINQILGKKFEIIFLDPPYKENKLYNLLDEIFLLRLLKKNGVIIIHRHKKQENSYPENFNVLKVKIYGISKIVFGN